MSLKIDRVQLEIVIGNDQARKRMLEIDKEVRQLNREITKMQNSGADTSAHEARIKALRTEYDKLIDKIGLTGLSMKELRNRQKELNAILNNLPGNSPLYEQYKKQLDDVNNRMRELRDNAKQTQKSLESGTKQGGFLNIMKGVFAGNLLAKGAMMLGDLAIKAREFVREGIQMAAVSQGIQHAFERIADRDYLKGLRNQTKGLVNDLTLMKSAVRAENFNIPLSQLGTLFEFAQNRARDTGESVDYLVESIINGIGRKSPLILDNLGISAVRLQQEVKKTGDFAAAVGKIVEEEMAKAGPAIDTATDAATRKKVAWENLQLTMGNFFVGFRSGWDDFVTNFANGLSQIFAGQQKASVQFEDQINKVAELNVNLAPLVDRYEELKKKTVLTSNEQKELNKIMQTIDSAIPGVISQWDEYGNILSINTGKVHTFIAAQKDMLQYLYQDQIKEAEKNLEKYNKKLRDLQEREDDYKRGYSLGDYKTGPDGRQYRPIIYWTDKQKQKYAEDLSKHLSLKSGAEKTLDEMRGKNFEKNLKDREDQIRVEKVFNEMNKAELKKWIENEKNAADQYYEIGKKIYNSRFGSGIETPETPKSTTPKKEKEDPFKKELELLKEKQKQEILILKQGLLDKDVTEDEFRTESFQKEVEHLQQLRALYEQHKQSTVDIDVQLTDLLIAESNRKYKELQDAAAKNEKELEDIRKDADETRKKEDELRQKEAEQKRRDIMDKIADEHRELFEFLYDLNLEWLSDFLDEWGDATSAGIEAMANMMNAAINFNKAEEMAVERKYDKMIKAAGNNSQRVQQLEEEKEKKLHAIRAKYADKQFIITVANVIASTAVAAMEAYKAMSGIPVVGPVLGGIAAAAALAFGASQIAVAKQQRDAAKEGYYDGGYTDKGDDRDEAGVVHKNEFVNTAEAVRNPHVKKFLDVFDVAQKDGSIRMLNTTQILERARLGVSDQLRAVSPGSYRKADDQVNVILNRLTASVDRFTEKLDEPIESFTVISGPRGSRKRNEMYDKIMRNARL